MASNAHNTSPGSTSMLFSNLVLSPALCPLVHALLQPPSAAGALDPFAPAPALVSVGAGVTLGPQPATAATVTGNSNGGGSGFGGAAAPTTGAAGPVASAAPVQTAVPPPSFIAFEKDGLSVAFELSKPAPAEDPSTTHIKATFRNSGGG